MREIDAYWEGARRHYLAFESDMRAGAATVFEHGMPVIEAFNRQVAASSA